MNFNLKLLSPQDFEAFTGVDSIGDLLDGARRIGPCLNYYAAACCDVFYGNILRLFLFFGNAGWLFGGLIVSSQKIGG